MTSVRNYIDRLLRVKAEQDDLGCDARDIYAEAKSNGLDKMALRQAVSTLRKKAKDPNAFEERSAKVDEYLSEYEQPSRAHERAREDNDVMPRAKPALPVGIGHRARNSRHTASDESAVTMERGAPAADKPQGTDTVAPSFASEETRSPSGVEGPAPIHDDLPDVPAFLDRRSAA